MDFTLANHQGISQLIIGCNCYKKQQSAAARREAGDRLVH